MNIIRAKAPLRISFGGGGYLLLLCEFDKWHIVAKKLEELGGKVTHFAFEFNGLQTWKVNTTASTEGRYACTFSR